jgi:hypothetical protein
MLFHGWEIVFQDPYRVHGSPGVVLAPLRTAVVVPGAVSLPFTSALFPQLAADIAKKAVIMTVKDSAQRFAKGTPFCLGHYPGEIVRSSEPSVNGGAEAERLATRCATNALGRTKHNARRHCGEWLLIGSALAAPIELYVAPLIRRLNVL